MNDLRREEGLDSIHSATPEQPALAPAGPLPTMLGGLTERIGASAVQRKLVQRALQRHGQAEAAQDPATIHQAAQRGTGDAGGVLPHMDRIQQSFGPSFDVSGVKSHTGAEATAAAESMHAEAFAVGEHVAFAGAPSLHTAAHEAAHVVQQRAGVHLAGGVGALGDPYERHADAVADLVVRGDSAAELLGTLAGPARGAGAGDAVQRLGYDLEKPLPRGAEKPAEGEDAGHQRRYSVEQFIAMWEKEQGHKLSAQELATLARGCIGITALNLHAGGNPPLDNAYSTFEEAQAAQKKMNAALDKMRADPHLRAQVGHKHAVIFAKLFWSNQDPDQEKRKAPDDHAFKPDAKTGKVDMTGYAYRAQPGYVNFDYGFWDDASHCFWHANHSQPGMKVYQSTKEKFAKGYIDFDRIIYCAAIADNYDPTLAAIATARPHS